MTSRDSRPPQLTNRAFGLFMGGALAVVSGIVGWHTGHVPRPLASVAGAFLVVGLVLPSSLLPLNRLWTNWIAPRVGRFNNRVLLGLIYFGVLTPVAAVLRARGRDPMARTIEPQRASYLETVGRQATPATYRDPF